MTPRSILWHNFYGEFFIGLYFFPMEAKTKTTIVGGSRKNEEITGWLEKIMDRMLKLLPNAITVTFFESGIPNINLYLLLFPGVRGVFVSKPYDGMATKKKIPADVCWEKKCRVVIPLIFPYVP